MLRTLQVCRPWPSSSAPWWLVRTPRTATASRTPTSAPSACGSTEKKTSYCYNIRDQDWRAYCLTRADGQRSHCYNIQSKDLKAQCLASATK